MQDRSLGNEFTNLFRRIQTLEEEIQSIRSQLATTHAGNRLVATTIVGIVPPGGGGTGYTTGSGPTIQPFINNTGGALEDGDVVVLDPTGTRLINTTTTPADILVIGVVRDLNTAGPFAAAAETPVMLLGNNATVKVTGAVAAGDYLQASASAGEAESAGATPDDGVFAIAETAFAGPGSGTVSAFIYGIDSLGGGGSVPTGGTTGQALMKDSATNFDASWHDVEDVATAETDASLVLAPDGAGGVEFRAENSGALPVGMTFQNEVKAWPPLVPIGAGFDLVTNAQWWADEATPTTKATAVPSSGEAGLDAKFTDVIKCVTDAANEGFRQRYTYADEPRVKSGAKLSALIWVATTGGGTGITAQLRNSDATFTSFTSIATDGDWSLLSIANHTCAGTYVELVITKDASGTFYAGGPITVMLGTIGVMLPPRKTVQRWYDGDDDLPTIKTLTGIGDEVTWTDIDVTSVTSNLACRAYIQSTITEATSANRFDLGFRRNGSAGTPAPVQINITQGAVAELAITLSEQLLDDAQIFEYYLDRNGGATTLDFGVIYLRGWEEWE